MDDVSWFKSKQLHAALAATLAMVNVGNEEFWVANTMRNIQKINSTSENITHYIVAGLFLAASISIFGVILGAVLADRFGRKKILLATGIFLIIQIFGSISSNSILSCFTLFVGEIGSGMTRVAVPLYVSEIVDDKIRGALLMLQLPFFYIGKLIAVGIGVPGSPQILGIISLISTIIFLVAITFFPESPYYLASKKNDEEAIRSLAFFEGITIVAAENKIGSIMKNVEPKNGRQGYCGKIHELFRPTNRKGLMIIIFLIFLKWNERIFDTSNNMVPALIDTFVSSLHEAKIIAHLTSLITSFLIIFVIDKIGRRRLLLLATSVGFIAIIFLMLSGSRDHAWVYDTTDIILYFCELIIFSVLTVYVGELFSANAKALAIAILISFDLLTSFLIIAVPEVTGIDVSPFINGILLLFAFPLTFAFFPETKVKSFSEIQSELTATLHSEWLRNKLIRANRFT